MSDSKHSNSERRSETRFELRVPAKYLADDCRGKGTVENISRSGAWLDEVSKSPPAGTRLSLELRFFDGGAITLSARVVREADNGFAVQFVDVNPRTRELLEALLPSAADLTRKS